LTGTGIDLEAARAPAGMRLYAIGDVHGRLDLLEAMHDRIEGEIARDRPGDWRILHLGDYVDRGRDSAGVVDRLIAARAADPRLLALVGNHDIGFLDFLGLPDPAGLFARYGGVETARSYGVRLDPDDGRSFAGQVAELSAAVPEAHRTFLRGLPYSLEFGDFFFCHAGIRPGVPLHRQERRDLIWIRDAFLDHVGLHPKVVVHGHTPAPRAQVLANRVNVDTGAFRSNRLTALVVDGASKRTIEVSV
jgi:serine/threonine protein phosphatase 1